MASSLSSLLMRLGSEHDGDRLRVEQLAALGQVDCVAASAKLLAFWGRPMAELAQPDHKLNVFISYSRDDLAFADQLDAALRPAGFETTIDRDGISPGEDWQKRLGGLIRDADTVIFVLSPSSARSDVCAWEVAEAVRLGKRILPVLCRPLESENPPPHLAELNYIFFYAEPKSPSSGWGTGLGMLASALNTDRAIRRTNLASLHWRRDRS